MLGEDNNVRFYDILCLVSGELAVENWEPLTSKNCQSKCSKQDIKIRGKITSNYFLSAG